MVIILCILLAAAIGGGIYVWVKRQRKLLLQRAKSLAESSNILDPSKPSVLDSVVSPVSNSSTSSTASDHPQINVSPEATNGENGAHPDQSTLSGGDSTAAAKAEDPTVKQSKYAARFRHAAPTIKELAAKLMAAWDQATEAKYAADRAWKSVGRYRSTVFCGNDCRFVSVPLEAPEFIDNLNNHFVAELTGYRDWVTLAAKVDPSSQAAKAAFEALRLVLAPFYQSDSYLLPPDLQVLCNAAHLVLSTSRESIEKQLKEAQEVLQTIEKEELAGKPLKHDRALKLFVSDEKTFAEGTHKDDQDDIFEARSALKAAVVSAIEAVLKNKASQEAAEEVFDKLETIDDQKFTLPQKPTPEEVVRFLTEVEEWSRLKLNTERQVAPLMEAANEGLKGLKEAIKDLKRSRGRTTPVLTDAARFIDEALICAVNKVVTDLETKLQSTTSELAKLAEKQPRVSDPVSKVTSEEEGKIDLLRQQARTVAFALAQRSVACTKFGQVTGQEPAVDHSLPRVDRSDPFEKLLDRYQVLFDLKTKQEEEHCQWEAARDMILMAYEARKEKVSQTSAILATQLAVVQKASSGKTADELLIVGSMSAKIVKLG